MNILLFLSIFFYSSKKNLCYMNIDNCSTEDPSRHNSLSNTLERTVDSFDSTQEETGYIRDLGMPIIDPLICDANKIVEAYGNKGLYQWLTAIQISSMMLFYSANMHVLPFLTEQTITQCNIKSTNMTLEGCDQLINGVNVTCGSDETTSIVSYSHPKPITSMWKDFEMPCTSYWVREAGQTAFTFGALTIVPVLSLLADRFGRKLMFLITVYLSIAFNFATAFAPTFWSFVVLRFMVGSTSDSYYSIGNIYGCEITTEKQRNYIGMITSISWAIGICYVGMLSQLIFNWRHLYFFMTLPSIFSILFICCLPESPHWAIRHRKRKAVENYVKSSNYLNRVQIDLSTCVNKHKMEEKQDNRDQKTTRESIHKMFTNKRMLKVMGICGLLTFALNFFYFAISLEAVDLTEDRFTAFMLSGVVDIPGAISSVFLMSYMGRKTLCISTCVVSGILLIVSPFVDGLGQEWFKIAFILCAKFVNIIGQAVISVWSTEMLPTTVRILAFSMINVPQSMGQILAPFFRHWNFAYAPTKYLGLGVFSIVAGLSGLFLEETKGKRMPEHIDVMGSLREVESKNRAKSPVLSRSNGKTNEEKELQTE